MYSELQMVKYVPKQLEKFPRETLTNVKVNFDFDWRSVALFSQHEVRNAFQFSTAVKTFDNSNYI